MWVAFGSGLFIGFFLGILTLGLCQRCSAPDAETQERALDAALARLNGEH